jgi:hypothetical protein
MSVSGFGETPIAGSREIVCDPNSAGHPTDAGYLSSFPSSLRAAKQSRILARKHMDHFAEPGIRRALATRWLAKDGGSSLRSR